MVDKEIFKGRGVETEEYQSNEVGSAQGNIIIPVLENIYICTMYWYYGIRHTMKDAEWGRDS